MSNPLVIRLLGRFEVQQNGGFIPEIQATKTLALLSYLAVTARPHARPALAGLLWGGMPEAKARDSLSKALSTLRQGIGTHLTITRQTVSFNKASDYWLDVAEFEAGINGRSIEGLQAAVRLYEGDFLEGFSVRNAVEFDYWILAQQARLKSLAWQALHTLAAHFAGQDAAGRVKAIDYTNRLLILEPWREEAHRQMMRLLALNGQRGAALAQFETCRRLLGEALSVEPGPETIALYEQIREGKLSGAAKGTPSRHSDSPSHSPSSIPIRFPSKLIGRTAQLKVLAEAWQQASQGKGLMVLVAGEPGIGKTRLVEEFLESGLGSVTILHTKCPEMNDPLAYTLFVDSLRQALIPSLLSELSDTWLVELSRLLPEIKERYPGLTQPPQLDPATERRRLFDAIGKILHTLTAQRPLILFLDDLQWADATSLALLNHLAASATNTPMLIIGTFRSNEVSRNHPLRQTQAVWQRLSRFESLHLPVLTLKEVHQLIRELTGWSGENSSFGQLINQETQGNPLFLVETIASLRDEGRLPQSAEMWQQGFQADQLSIPSQVQTIIQNRLNRLDHLSRQIVTAVAVFRNSFSLAAIMSISQYSEAELLEGLDTLLMSGLLIEQDETTLTFSHDKIREVAYKSLSRLRRRKLHQWAAEGLELDHKNHPEMVANQLAYHFERAGMKDKAWQYHALAGHRAQAQYAHEAAVHHYQQAITLAPAEMTVAQAQVQVNLYEGLGEILQALGRYTEAEVACGAMLTAAIHSDDRIAQVRAWTQLGLTQWWLEKYQAALDSEIQAEKIARAVGEAGQIPLIKVLAIKAWALVYLGETEAALLQSEAAVRLGTSSDPPPFLELAECFFVLGRVHIGLRRYQQSINHLQTALSYFRKVGQRRKAAEVWAVLAGLVGEAVSFEQGLTMAGEALNEAREIGHHQAEIFCLQRMGLANLHLGQYQTAEADLRQAIALAEISEANYELSNTYANLTEVCLRQDRIAEADKLGHHALALGRALKQTAGIAKAWHSLGLVSARSGQPINIDDQAYDALACFATSQQIFIEADEEIERARLLRNWATYDLRQGNRSSGVGRWHEAKNIFESVGLKPEANEMCALPDPYNFTPQDLAASK